MKKSRLFSLVLAVLLVLPLCFLVSCKPKPEHVIPNCHFVAKVTEVKEGQLFVTVINAGWSSLKDGTPAYVSTDFDGYVAPAPGDYVIVEYDSMVQELYPPIVPNVFSITKCDANGNPLK
ncbi:MAG: hypothetical protein IJD75_07940 [Clostridia bacterium]|nr:hypothetical protein [Clostridia bacterium]